MTKGGWATALALAAGPLCPAPAAAQVALKPLIDTRVRYESDEQQGLAKDGDDLVIRVRAGLQATDGPLAAIVEGQGTLAAVDRYNDGLNGRTDRPMAYDPQDIALYRAQLQYKVPTLTLTAGRQRIALDDERFVGGGNWRINGQTFDAVRAAWVLTPKLKLDASYVRAFRTPWGVNGTGARPQAIGGNSALGELAWTAPVGTLVGFAYLIEENAAGVQGFRLDQQNFGVRLFGARPLGHGVKVAYKATWARQSEWRRNPNDYAASYLQGDATLNLGGASLNGGYERLGADRGVALTSFQFPFGANFNYQGWADKFLTTPPDGLHDLYASGGYAWRKVGPLDAMSVQAVGHRFTSDLYDRHDGDELDLLATAKRGRTSVQVRYADYRADKFATDTRRLWLQADWVF